MSSNSPSPILSFKEVQRLENEFRVLHLIYHRNHNQHHVAIWWKNLNQLHRRFRKMLRNIYEFEETKKHLIKQRLHTETLALARSMIKTRLFTRCYYSFNGIVALGQFVGLGLTLLGNLSALYDLTMKISGLHDMFGSGIPKANSSSSKKVSGTPDLSLDDDLGEEIVFEEKQDAAFKEKENLAVSESSVPMLKRKLDDIESIFGEKPKKKTKEKKKKEKKKKSAMDDIFG